MGVEATIRGAVGTIAGDGTQESSERRIVGGKVVDGHNAVTVAAGIGAAKAPAVRGAAEASGGIGAAGVAGSAGREPAGATPTHGFARADAKRAASKKGRAGSGARRALIGLLVPAAIVVAWVAATNANAIPESILPKITTVFTTLGALAQDGTLGSDLSISLVRVLEGYALAAVIGIGLGSIMGMSRIARELFLPMITALRQIPLLAWIPLLILWCGIGEASKVVFIVLAAFFPILANTLAGIASTPLDYVEVARLNKLSRWETFVRVYLPHALPQIQTGLKLGLGVSWMAVVGAELIASTSGMGYRMSYARTLMQSDVVIAYMFVVGLVGIVMDKVVTAVFAALTPWERKGRERA